MTEAKPKIIKWSKSAHSDYNGVIADGWVRGRGYIKQAIDISRNPQDFRDADLLKAARVLSAAEVPAYQKLATVCRQEIAGRKTAS